MKLVHIVQSQHVEVDFHRVQIHKMATRVEVHTTITEIRPVADSSAREKNFTSPCPTNRQALPQGLNAIKHTCSIGTFNNDLLWRDVDLISLSLAEIGRSQLQDDAIRLVALHRLDWKLIMKNVIHILAEKLRLTLQPIFKIDSCFRAESEASSISSIHLFRQGNDIK